MATMRDVAQYAGIRPLFSRPDPPTAIFACNDRRAIDALEAAAAAGIRVPSALSIIGFDDIRSGLMTHPSLTTLAQPRKEIGELAVRLLLERIRDPGLPPRTEVLAPRLVVRESTARVPGRV